MKNNIIGIMLIVIGVLGVYHAHFREELKNDDGLARLAYFRYKVVVWGMVVVGVVILIVSD